MPSKFDRFNQEYEIAHPTEPNYTETGENTPTSIQRWNNGEDADEDTFRRPVEQLRRRSRHVEEELNLVDVHKQGRFGCTMFPDTTSVTWNGLSGGNAGIFELSGSVYFVHPMYPDTTIELPAAVVGNAGTGFFADKFNRLLEDGDSIWITFGDEDETSIEREAKSRPVPGLGAVVVQSQLRKGPTWTLLKETVLDLSTAGIIAGDKVRIYPDPVGAPAVYKTFTVRSIISNFDGSEWFLEVSTGTPFYDDTTTPTIPPVPSVDKLVRSSGGAEYVVLDSTETITRVAQRSFSAYYSNLMFFEAGRVYMPVPEDASPKYRENEWQYAIPVAVVKNNKLIFPLLGGASIPASSTAQSPHSFVRLTEADVISASHLFTSMQSIQMANDSELFELKTTSSVLTGQGSVRHNLIESHNDGISASYWIAPARPAKVGFKGRMDNYASPYIDFVEQGFHSGGAGYKTKYTSLRMRKAVDPLVATTDYRELKEPYLSYLLTADSYRNLQLDFFAPMDTAVLTAWLDPGEAITTPGTIILGSRDQFDTITGKHLLYIEGEMSIQGGVPFLYDIDAGTTPEVAIHGLGYEYLSETHQTLPFRVLAEISPGINPTDPLGITVLFPSTKNLHFNIAKMSVDPTYASPTIHATPTLQVPTNKSLIVAANSNDSFPAASTGVTTLSTNLFQTSAYHIASGAGTAAVHKIHSILQPRLLAKTTYNAGSLEHELDLYVAFDLYTAEADPTPADRYKNYMYLRNFKSSSISDDATFFLTGSVSLVKRIPYGV